MRLTEAQVREIKIRYAEGGVTQRELGAEYGVSHSTVCRYVRGESRTEALGPTGDYRDRSRILGERNPKSKLAEAQVQEIRDRYAAGGVSLRDLASVYGMSYSTIGWIVRGEGWVRSLRET